MQPTILNNHYELQTLRHLTYDDVYSVNYLLAYLSPTRPIQTHSSEELNSKLICGSGLTLFVARELSHQSIVAMVSLVRIERLSRSCGWIEDVVVHKDHQRKGLARALVSGAITTAQARGMKHLDLTSGLARVEAHALYKSLGFKRRKTSVWRMRFDI